MVDRHRQKGVTNRMLRCRGGFRIFLGSGGGGGRGGGAPQKNGVTDW